MEAKNLAITIDELRMRVEDLLEEVNWVCGNTSEMTVTEITGFLNMLEETLGWIVRDFDCVEYYLRPVPKISAANLCRQYALEVDAQTLIALQNEAAHLSAQEGLPIGFQPHLGTVPGGITFDRTILYRAASLIGLLERIKPKTREARDDTTR